jgi:small GTP-binding protein
MKNAAATSGGAPTLKFLLIGESGVGKTCLLLRFVDDMFNPSFMSTVGIDFKVKTIRLTNGKEVKLQIWDTAGQERFRTITKAFYRGAMAVLLVFDVTQKESFDSLPRWMEEVDINHVAPHILRILIANKSDLVAKRVVGDAEARGFASQHGYLYAETSASSGKGVDNVFREMADRVWAQLAAAAEEKSDGVEVNVVELKEDDDDAEGAEEVTNGPSRANKSGKCC